MPDVAPACGDVAGAWAPGSSSGNPEWLDVSFALYMVASRILIYETYRAPFVTSVELVELNSASTTVFAGTDDTSCGSALEVVVPNAVPPVHTIRINTQRSGYELSYGRACPRAKCIDQPIYL